MSLADCADNKPLAKQLTALLTSGRLVHAFLFIGGQKSRLRLGKELAKAILCEGPVEGDSCGTCASCRKFEHGNHEDFLYVDLETAPGTAKTQIGVDAVEFVHEELKKKPFGARHAVLIEEAHLLNAAAQNKLLKTLEEPAGDSVLILLSEKRQALLDTVVSRCSVYHLQEEDLAPDEASLELARSFFTLFCKKALFYRKKDCLKPLLEEKSEQKGRSAAFLHCFRSLLRDALLSPYGAEASSLSAAWDEYAALRSALDREAIKQALHATEEAEKSIRLGYNAGYALKKLCLDL